MSSIEDILKGILGELNQILQVNTSLIEIFDKIVKQTKKQEALYAEIISTLSALSQEVSKVNNNLSELLLQFKYIQDNIASLNTKVEEEFQKLRGINEEFRNEIIHSLERHTKIINNEISKLSTIVTNELNGLISVTRDNTSRIIEKQKEYFEKLHKEMNIAKDELLSVYNSNLTRVIDTINELANSTSYLREEIGTFKDMHRRSIESLNATMEQIKKNVIESGEEIISTIKDHDNKSLSSLGNLKEILGDRLEKMVITIDKTEANILNAINMLSHKVEVNNNKLMTHMSNISNNLSLMETNLRDELKRAQSDMAKLFTELRLLIKEQINIIRELLLMNKERIEDARLTVTDLWLDLYTGLLIIKSEMENIRRLYSELMFLTPKRGEGFGKTANT